MSFFVGYSINYVPIFPCVPYFLCMSYLVFFHFLFISYTCVCLKLCFLSIACMFLLISVLEFSFFSFLDWLTDPHIWNAYLILLFLDLSLFTVRYSLLTHTNTHICFKLFYAQIFRNFVTLFMKHPFACFSSFRMLNYVHQQRNLHQTMIILVHHILLFLFLFSSPINFFFNKLLFFATSCFEFLNLNIVFVFIFVFVFCFEFYFCFN